MNKTDFYNSLKQFGIVITEEQKSQLAIYCEELIKCNKLTNLTSIDSEEGIYLKHFFDSLTIIKAIDLKYKKNLMDIGTGAGFPGLILKIFFPDLNITLLDSNHKKTDFLKHIVENLKLSGVTIVNNRAEEYYKICKLKYDIVVSRAVADMSILVEIALPFIAIGGYFIAMKGNLTSKENEYKKCLRLLGSEQVNEIEFSLPVENSIRKLIIIKKLEKSNKRYPRPYNKILKKL